MSLIGQLITTFKDLWFSSEKEKEEIEGYLLLSDTTTNKTLLLVKDTEKSWKTKWFNNTEHIFKAPSQPLNSIFNV